MSILNGSISNQSIYPETPPFGTQLKETMLFPLSKCHDIALDENAEYAFAVHEGGLSVYNISNPGSPAFVSMLEGIKEPREIKICNGFAFIAARSNGLYIVDVSNPLKPHLASTYDTIELATGVDAADGLCFVANRHLGVEIIDVTQPSKPRYITSFLCGEAQSVFACNGYLYIGDWMNKQVYIVSIDDQNAPKVASVLQIDGFADGIFVLDNICYVASGHHSNRLKNRRKYDAYPYLTPDMIAEGYGCGHGLELFDVSDPEHPEWISTIKFPPLYGSPDIWKVTVSEHNAYVSDSNNGLFVVNVEDVYHPYIEAYFLDRCAPINNYPIQGVQVRHAPILNCTCANGYLYLAGYESGFYVVEYGKSKKVRRNSALSSAIKQHTYKADKLFSCDGQVHNAVEYGEYYLVAAGDRGLLAVDKIGNVIHKITEDKTVLDVRCGCGFVFAAEGCDGTAVYRFDNGNGFALCDRLIPENASAPVRQIAVLDNGFIAQQVGVTRIDFAKVSDNGKLAHINHFINGEMMYYRNICQPLFKGKYFGYSSLKNGVSWYEVSEQNVQKTKFTLNRQSCPIEAGFAVTPDYAVIIYHQKYALMRDIKRSDEAALDFKAINGASLKGIPFICGSHMVVLNRCLSFAEIIDISNPENPIFEERLSLDGHPCSAELIHGEICISCGHAGVYVIRKKEE